MSATAFVLGLAFTISCAGAAVRIAAYENRSTRLWLWLAAIFGPLALGVLLFLPTKRVTEAQRA